MNREILRLAGPNIISNISIPLLSTVDTILMGHLSVIHLGAIGLSSMIFNLVYWNFGFLRMATTGQVAQAYGAGDYSSAYLALIRGLMIALVLAMLFILGSDIFFDLGESILSIQSEHRSLIYEYFSIRIYAAPASFCLFVLLGWYFGMQNALIPLLITIGINTANILLSYYLVKIESWGIAGAAYGTVGAQYLGLMMAVAFMYRYPIKQTLVKLSDIIDSHALLSYFRISFDLFIRTLLLSMSFAFFYRLSANLGVALLGANVILLQFLNWMSYIIDGFAYAAESIVGKYYGMKDRDQLIRSIKYCLVWGLGISMICSGVYWIFGDQLIQLFSNDVPAITNSQEYISWMIIIPIIAFASYIWDGVFIGLLRTRAMRDTMILSFSIYVGSYYGLRSYITDINHALWLAMLIFLLSRGLLQTIWWWMKIRPNLTSSYS